jgi:hypothetical protein
VPVSLILKETGMPLQAIVSRGEIFPLITETNTVSEALHPLESTADNENLPVALIEIVEEVAPVFQLYDLNFFVLAKFTLSTPQKDCVSVPKKFGPNPLRFL